MKRTIAISSLAALLTLGLPMTAHAEGTGPCSGWFSNIRPAMGQARVQHRVEHLIDCAVRIWPVAGGNFYARSIAERESGDWPWAVNESSGCVGLFQHVASMWPGRARFYLHRGWFSRWAWDRGISPFSARANVLVSIRMAHSGGWGPWS
jgi:hypothetical protein